MTTNKRATLKTATQNLNRAPRLRRTPLNPSELPPEAMEFRRKFQEWEESFRNPAQRMAYIERVCARIVSACAPEKIILFGSHVWGQPTPESDIDLLVVMNFAGEPIHQAIRLSRELGLVTPLDLLVRTPQQVAERLQSEDLFMREILERGKVMYEAKHA